MWLVPLPVSDRHAFARVENYAAAVTFSLQVELALVEVLVESGTLAPCGEGAR